MSGDERDGMRLRRRWVRLSPEALARREFERLVAEAVKTLPAEFRARLENVDVVVEEEPSPAVRSEAGLSEGETLYGYYQGVPHDQRGSSYSMTLPDKITIFRQPILADSRTRGQVRRLVRSTVVHEIAHHFGISDAQLRRLGLS